jgi:hypothetical protein
MISIKKTVLPESEKLKKVKLKHEEYVAKHHI